MGYFPFFVDLSGKEGLVVGGGDVALRKIEKLLPYGPHLTVAALSWREELEQIQGLSLVRKAFEESMVEGKYFVIAATDDQALNEQISRLCRERNILVNVVDDKEECTFLFPSLVKRGKLSIGISTEGASPSGAIHIKNHLNQWLPKPFDEILDFLEETRILVKAQVPQEKRRSLVFSKMFEQCMEKGRGLTEGEMREILNKADEDD